MQSKKAIVIVLVALMITGGMGYFLQTEHHTVEKLTYDYRGDTGPSVQYSQIDEWAEYNPLDNVTGWNRDGGNVEVPILASGSSQYILKKATYEYLEKPVSTSTFNYLPMDAPLYEGNTAPLSPYWLTYGQGIVPGISSQGAGNNYPENWGEGDFHEVFCVGLGDEDRFIGTVEGEEALKYVNGGYSQSTEELTYVPSVPSIYSYKVYNYLDFILNINNGASVTKTDSHTPVYFVGLNTYIMEGLKTRDVIDISNLPNFGIITSRTVAFEHNFYTDWNYPSHYHGTVRQTVTMNVSTLDLPSTYFIYNADNKLWFPAIWDEEDQLYKAVQGGKGYASSEIGFYYIGQPTQGIQSYCESHIPRFYSAIQSPVQYADPSKYVIVHEGKTGEWSNKETNGIVRLLASSETVVSVNDGRTNISIPVIPYEYVYITLDFINKEFYCQGVIYPKDDSGNPLITTVDFQVDDYLYPLTVSGEPLPDSVTELGFFGKEKTVYQYLSVNLTPNVWYNTELTGRNIPAMSIMYDNVINPLEFNKETSTDYVYNIVNADGTIGSMAINKATNVALVSYYESSYHAGSFRLTLEHTKYADSLVIGEETYQLILESVEYTTPTQFNESYGIYKAGTKVGSTIVKFPSRVAEITLNGGETYAGWYSFDVTISDKAYVGTLGLTTMDNTLSINTYSIMFSGMPQHSVKVNDTVYTLTNPIRSPLFYRYTLAEEGGTMDITSDSLTITFANGEYLYTSLRSSDIIRNQWEVAFNLDGHYSGGWNAPTGSTIPYHVLKIEDTEYRLELSDSSDLFTYSVIDGSTKIGELTFPQGTSETRNAEIVISEGWHRGTYLVPISGAEIEITGCTTELVVDLVFQNRGGIGIITPIEVTYNLRHDYQGEIGFLSDQYDRLAVNLSNVPMESTLLGTILEPFTVRYDDTIYQVTDGTIADSGNEFWYQVKIDGTVVGSLKVDTTTGQAILTLLSTSRHEGVYTLTLNVPKSEHYMAFNYTNGTWTTSKGVALEQFGLIFDNIRYHCQPVHEPDTDDYYYNVMPEGSTTVVGILRPYYYGVVLEMTTEVGYAQRTITYEVPIEWVEYPASSIVAVNPTNSDWYCPDIDMTLAPYTAIYHGNEYQLSTTPSVSSMTATITYPITYKGGGPVVGSYSEKYWSGGSSLDVYSTFSVVGSIEKTVTPTARSSQIYVSYINPSYYSGTYGSRTLEPYKAVIEGIPLDFVTGRTFDCEPIQEEEQNTGWYSISYRGVEIGRYRPLVEWRGPTYVGEIIIYGPEPYNETHYFTNTISNPIPATAGPSPMLVVNKDLYGYTMVTDIPYTAVGQIGEAPKLNYTIVNLGSTTLTTPMGIQVPGNTVYDAGTNYKLNFVSKEGNVERHNLTLGDSSEIKGYLYVDDVTFEGYLQIIGQDRWDFTLEEGLFSAYRSYGTGKVIQSYGYYGEEILTKGVGCEVFIIDTTVAVDPLGILWGDPDMYLGYYFEEQMTHDTRLLFNGFVKTGHTMTLNGQTFEIPKDGYILVPLGEDGELIEQHMNGMALDFIDNHVYLVFTQDKDKTLDLGVLDNRPIMVPGTTKVMQQGFLVAATGNWYWESGLYNVVSVEAEEYGFLINGSFGLDMSSAAFLMIGIIIICTAAMMYINREDEFSFVDWVILALAVIILLVLAIIG